MRSFSRILIPATLLLPMTATAEADCSCRASGVVAEHGQTMCIRTPDGYRLARCDKVSNVASWTFLGTACPQVASSENRSHRPPGSKRRLADRGEAQPY